MDNNRDGFKPKASQSRQAPRLCGKWSAHNLIGDPHIKFRVAFDARYILAPQLGGSGARAQVNLLRRFTVGAFHRLDNVARFVCHESFSPRRILFRYACLAFGGKKAADRRDQFSPGFRFLKESAIGEHAPERNGLFWRVVAADEDDLRSESALVNLVCGFDAAHFRHYNIHHHDMRLEFADSIKGHFAVFGLVDFPMGLHC